MSLVSCMTLDSAFHLSVPQFPWLQSGLYTNRGSGVPGERDTSMALGRNPQKASPGPCQNSLGCEGQWGRWMLSSRRSELRHERRKESDSFRGSQKRRVQTSEARLDPKRTHAAPPPLGTGRGAGGQAERATRGELREGRPRGPGACRMALGPQRNDTRAYRTARPPPAVVEALTHPKR